MIFSDELGKLRHSSVKSSESWKTTPSARVSACIRSSCCPCSASRVFPCSSTPSSTACPRLPLNTKTARTLSPFWTRQASRNAKSNHLPKSQTTDQSRTCPLSCFASINSWFVTRNHEKLEVCDSGIHLNYKILISSSYSTASQNGTTRQTDEGWCSRRFCIPVSETGFAG